MNEDLKTAAGVLAITLVFALVLGKKKFCAATRLAFWSLAFGLGSLFFEFVIPAIIGGVGCLGFSICAYHISHQHGEGYAPPERNHHA